MPMLYLSPSTQEGNFYVSGNTEEYYMNLLADAMEPWLRSSGISFTRNTPDMTAVSSIAASNAGNYRLHLALHSNASPEASYGQTRGSIAFYYPGSTAGKRAADLIVKNLKMIYPLPDLVRAEATTAIGEVRRTRAPAVLLELAYHDNVEDAAWITGNLDAIARNLVLSLTEYFGLPLIEPGPVSVGTVSVRSGWLNIRSRPTTAAPVAARAYNGARLILTGRYENWYSVEFGGVTGFASADYIDEDE